MRLYQFDPDGLDGALPKRNCRVCAAVFNSPMFLEQGCRSLAENERAHRLTQRTAQLSFQEDHAMDRNELIIAEAMLNGRRLTAERSAEIAREVEVLMKASLELGSRVTFDDQASDFAHALVETARQRSH